MTDSSDDWLDADAFARRRGVSRERLADLVAKHKLFSMERDGQPHFPSFFVNEAYGVRDLEMVCRRLGSLPAMSKWQFFVTPKGSLGGRTPLEALREGSVAAVKVAADGFRER